MEMVPNSQGTPIPPQAGDKMELCNVLNSPLPYASITVKKAETDLRNKGVIVEFSDEIPDINRTDYIANASSCPSVNIRGCNVI